MGKLRGITVRLHVRTPNGVDAFNKQKWTEDTVDIENVLVGEPSATDITNTTELYGRKAQYTLAIPKGDDHDWENVVVEFFGEKWKTFGIPVKGIEANIPLDWNTKVMVERYG